MEPPKRTTHVLFKAVSGTNGEMFNYYNVTGSPNKEYACYYYNRSLKAWCKSEQYRRKDLKNSHRLVPIDKYPEAVIMVQLANSLDILKDL
ncbi:MAG: hypothetical protein HRU18_03145 [Pseudoalteromonas sp.]|uniref:hypothetical protein n=1 Tax=Pseudoalteromonas sp. TaxID=53249 RepID=UPI001DAD3D45|nr:hypothetical protein [Pseudoalteromonas sp.]NRA77181.1 hypothetical protein [Pseudoalteromonas sp.]